MTDSICGYALAMSKNHILISNFMTTTGEELHQQQTELAAAYAEAKAERQRYRDLFAFAPDGYFVTDAKGKVREANQAACKLINVAPTRLDGRLLLTFIAPDDQPRFLDLLIRLKGGAPAEAWNVRVQRRDSGAVSTSVVAKPIRDAQGAVVGARWQFREVIEQVAQAEALRESEAHLEQRVAERTAELRASEERFRLVLQDSPVAVFHQDTDLRYTWIYNPAGGFSPTEIIGKTEHELLDQENADRLAAFKRRVLETGQGIREEIPWERDTETLWFDMKLEPLRDPNGTIIGLTAVSTDITAYHREAERQRFLDEVSILLITTQDPDSLLRQVAQRIAGRIADCCVFALPHGSSGRGRSGCGSRCACGRRANATRGRCCGARRWRRRRSGWPSTLPT